MMGEKINCHFCDKELLTEEEVFSAMGKDCCEECGDLLEKIVEEDVVISQMNEKYATLGLWKFIFGILTVVNFFLTYQALENSWDDMIGISILLISPIVTIGWVIFAIRRKILGKKLEREILTEFGIRKGHIHHIYARKGYTPVGRG